MHALLSPDWDNLPSVTVLSLNVSHGIKKEMPKPIRDIRKDCSGELEGICVKMIQKDPKYRYQSAGEEVASALEKFAVNAPVSVLSGSESNYGY